MRNRLLRRAGSPQPDAPLLVRARHDPELFAEYYAERYEQVLAFFARRVLDPEVAFDLMAETFAAAFASLPKFRGTTEMECHSWLWTIARNNLYRWRERGHVENRARERLGVDIAAMTTLEFERVEELADLDRVKDDIKLALDGLAPDQQAAVRLRVLDGAGYAEMAVRLGVSQDVARARVSRGLRQLAVALHEEREQLEEMVG
jgi:RNA polymerase sigma factor (sigma-70 family)